MSVAASRRKRRRDASLVAREAEPVVEPHHDARSRTSAEPCARLSHRERVRRIANARSVTVGLAVAFVGLALVGAIVMRFADSENFPSVGLAMWWALQTVTTVGYGNVVPTTSLAACSVASKWSSVSPSSRSSLQGSRVP